MASKKSQKTNFNGMSYGELQRANSENRNKLKKEDQKWLKDNGYKNVGWDNVITFYRKVEELLDKFRFEDMNLEELFLEADRIGNKYLSSEEIKEFDQQLSKEVTEIGEMVDKQFPDTEIEVIDFSQKTVKNLNKLNQKTYLTKKVYSNPN